MANKRMFSIDVVDTDKFLDMPVSTQALYFHFGMRADDDGFVSSPKKIVKIANCTNDDLRVLISKGYIIPFESGVVVITDWRKNNTLKGDRYKPTVYQEELEILETQGNSYVLKKSDISTGNNLEPDWNQIGTKPEPQYSIDKYSIDKNKYIVEQSPTMCPFKEIIEYLNQRTGKNYKYSSKATQKHIRARTKEGFSLEDFKRVIDWKVSEWAGTDMEKYLRPETLFGTKFEGYLNAAPLPKKLKVEEEKESSTEAIDFSNAERKW